MHVRSVIGNVQGVCRTLQLGAVRKLEKQTFSTCRIDAAGLLPSDRAALKHAGTKFSLFCVGW